MNLRAYLIRIGSKGAVRLEFAAMAKSSAEAFMQHMDLAQVNERVEIIAVGCESFPVKATRHQLAQAQLREAM